MKISWISMKKIIVITILILSLSTVLFVKTAEADDYIDFILPTWGGGMVHSDPKMSDYIRLPVPKNNVKILWHRNELSGEKAGAKGNAITGNGEIAACTFGGKKDNLVIYDYDGNRIWSSGDLLNFWTVASVAIIDINNRVIICDNRIIAMIDPLDYDKDGKIIEWTSKLVKGGLPFSPIITEDGTIIVATNNGPVYAFNITNGELLTYKYIGKNEKIRPLCKLLNIKDHGFFSTINTPCANGSRIYVLTEYKRAILRLPTLLHYGRLYAIDVDPDNPNVDERLKEAWHFEFGGPSQASPMFVNNTIYFDGYRPRPSLRKNPHLFALNDMGDHYVEKWRTSYPFETYASFTFDPRGGFWYVDPWGGKITRFSMDDGNIMEKIIIDDLVQEEGRHLPSSVMTMCGNDTNPILILSATALRPIKANSYVIAIDLAANNSLLWKVKLFSGRLLSIDLAFGQYTILMKNGEPRVVFGSFNDGVWAIGTPNIST